MGGDESREACPDDDGVISLIRVRGGGRRGVSHGRLLRRNVGLATRAYSDYWPQSLSTVRGVCLLFAGLAVVSQRPSVESSQAAAAENESSVVVGSSGTPVSTALG